MSKSNNYNPGTVNVSQVLETSRGVSSTQRRDGSIHTTAYDRERNARVSYDEAPDGTISRVHSTRQSDNSHTTYKGGK